MKRLGTFLSARWGTVNAFRATYGAEAGPVAVLLQNRHGEPLATLSVNMYRPECSADSRDLPAGCFYVKTWGGNEDLAADALASGMFLVRADIAPAQSGYVCAPAWQIVELDAGGAEAA